MKTLKERQSERRRKMAQTAKGPKSSAKGTWTMADWERVIRYLFKK